MNTRRFSQYHNGFTLIEVFLIVAISIMIMGIVYASAGNTREKARRSQCISNLRQIGQALTMYRQDYGGSDAPGWPGQMGLPPDLLILRNYMCAKLSNPSCRQIFFCPNDFQRTAASSYGWNVWGPDDHRIAPMLRPSFPAIIARRHGDYPLMYDANHDFHRVDRPTAKARYHILLSLDGAVRQRLGSGPSWEW